MSRPERQRDRERVLIVDDDEQVAHVIERILGREGYRTTLAGDLAAARAHLEESEFDLLLCDVQLPDGSGLDLVAEVLAGASSPAALMVSGIDEVMIAERALGAGAYGYVVKPFAPNEVLIGVLGALRQRQRATESSERADEEIIRRLSIAVEARDKDTAAHIDQMSEYCAAIALRLGMDPDFCRRLRAASPMHDVGKVGVPDHILLKPGALTPDERDVIQTHAEIGYRILAGSPSELLELAATIAWTHHERWDGRGYPRGLAGEEIPLVGRIAAVADVFDALTRDRVYRSRFSRQTALTMMRADRGTHFDVDVFDALVEVVSTPARARR